MSWHFAHFVLMTCSALMTVRSSVVVSARFAVRMRRISSGDFPAKFAAPVVYPSSLIPAWLRPLFLGNPMAAAIDSYRAALLGGVPLSPDALGLAAVTSGVLLVAGWTVLRRLDPRLREVL